MTSANPIPDEEPIPEYFVNLSLYTYDQATAYRIVEALSRVAVGLVFDGVDRMNLSMCSTLDEYDESPDGD